MGTTSKRGLRYPESTVLANTLHTRIKELAEDTEKAIDYTALGAQWYNNLAGYQESASNLTGYIVIQTNLTMLNVMTTLRIRGYDYTGGNNIIDMAITFYAYGAGNSIERPDFANFGSYHPGFVGAYTRNSDGKIAIVLGAPEEKAYQWQYPKVIVDGMFSHTHLDPDTYLRTGWSISRVDSAGLSSGYTQKYSYLAKYGATDDTGWITPTFETTWGQYAGAGATDWFVRYRRKAGIVYIKGLATTSSLPGQGVIFTLPVGFRPGNTLMFNNTDSSSLVKHLYVQGSNGIVYVPGGVQNLSWMNLQCQFPVG